MPNPIKLRLEEDMVLKLEIQLIIYLDRAISIR